MGKVISQVDIRKQEHNSEFPKLMIGNETGIIVLFNWPSRGTIINIGNGTTGLELGDYFTEWKMETFKDFHGTVILNNQ
ncbi:MAG: hypothetical protein ACK52I_37645 [Pseudomonadota bacterium]|jgi:hypothetical protein